jgi:hypothetical protein
MSVDVGARVRAAVQQFVIEISQRQGDRKWQR